MSEITKGAIDHMSHRVVEWEKRDAYYAACGYVDITPELLMELLKGLAQGGFARSFVVTGDGIPAGATFFGFRAIGDHSVRVYFEGAEPRSYLPTLRAVRNEPE